MKKKVIKSISYKETKLLDKSRTLEFFEDIYESDENVLYWYPMDMNLGERYVCSEYDNIDNEKLYMKEKFYKALAKHDIELFVRNETNYDLYFVFPSAQAKLQFILEAL